MAKKNTLKDLSAFLKNAAPKHEPQEGFVPNKLVDINDIKEYLNSGDMTEILSIEDLKKIIETFANQQNKSKKQVLFDLIKEMYGDLDSADASELMLLNTAFYLENADNIAEDIKKASGQ